MKMTMNLSKLGWNSFFDDQLHLFNGKELCVGRVLKEVRHQFTIYTAEGIVEGEVSGHFNYSATNRADYPTVGDWVVFRTYDNYAFIENVLSRKSTFSRKSTGNEIQEQVVAANIDYLCIVCGLDGGRNYNLRCIERYIAMAVEGGAKPVIVLNKSDLCTDREGALLWAQSITEDIPIHMVSALTREGLDNLSMSFGKGFTVAFSGHSGVGKSSLINSLLEVNKMRTGALRESDLRGKHTTSHKELFFLKSGAMVIDTPGMRELQLWGSQESLHGTYSEIYEAANKCRFKDCSHQNEPGCAVQDLLIDGSLTIERFENFLDMRSELCFLEAKVNNKKHLERKSKAKQLSKLIRKSQKNKY